MPQETDEDRQEAERLKLLPKAQQRAIIALYRDVARGKGVPAAERKASLRRAAALEKLLGISEKTQKNKK